MFMNRILVLLYFFAAFQYSCKKQAAVPASPLVDIDSAVLSQYDNLHIYARAANISNADIHERGFCWSTHHLPTKSDSTLKLSGSKSFDTTLLGIGQNAALYFRAYVQTPSGTIWSKETTIKTSGLKILWEKEYAKRVMDFRQAIRSDDNSFVVMLKMFGNSIAWTELVKLDTAGNILWDNQYNQNTWKEPEYILKIKNGYLFVTTAYVAGGKQSAVVMIDNDGNKVWEKGFNTSTWQEYVKLVAVSDTSYIFTNRAFDGIVHGVRQNCQLVDYTFNKNGDLLNQQTSLVNNKFAEGSYAIKTLNVSPNNGFLSATYYAPPSDYKIPFDIIVQRFINNQLQWEKTYGGVNDEIPAAVLPTVDNNYSILGYTNSKGTTDQSAWLFKIGGGIGEMLWDATYSNKTFGIHSATFPMDLSINGAGEYFIAGDVSDKNYSSTKSFLTKIDFHGGYLWEYTFENKEGYKFGRANTSFSDTDGTIYVFGLKIAEINSSTNLLYVTKLKE